MKSVSEIKKIPLNFFAKLILLTAMISLACPSFSSEIQINRDEPEAMLKQTTDVLLAMSKKVKTENDRPAYYKEVEVILNQVIDRQYFARGVMATYASSRQYNALKTDAEKNAFRERLSKFSDIMQIVLIEKYADALLLFKGERIDLENLVSNADDGSKTTLKQIIHDKDNKNYTVQYNLQKDSEGKWLVYNFIVEGVNLGSTYRNQFAEAVEKNKGDVDYVVSNWSRLLSSGEQ